MNSQDDNRIILKDRVEMPQMLSLSRYSPTPDTDYIIHIRERFNKDGTVNEIHRKRVYDDKIEDTTELGIDEM